MSSDPIEVVPGLGGGLGNQMFQIAMAHVFARQVGGVVALDESVWVSLGQGQGPGSYFGGLFSKFRRTRLRDDAYVVHESQWKPGLRPRLRLPRGVRQVCIRGFWQLPALWECEHQEIRDLFQFEVERNPRAGVHIRGGDYKFAHLQNRDVYHSQTGPHYYEQAIANLSMFPDFFTDDHVFLKRLAPSVSPVPGSEEEHFAGMAGCSELVLSKSTFAWWAAFLGEVSFVIMPAAWFWDCEFQPSWAMRIGGWEVFSPNSILWDFHRWHRDIAGESRIPEGISQIPPEEWGPWRYRTEILNDLICLTGALSYLEIGCGNGMNLRAIECESKSAVDSADDANACDSSLFKMEPEAFFESHNRSADLILIRSIVDSEKFGRILRLALQALSEIGVLACDGLKENGHCRQWRKFQMEFPGWNFISVDCENGIGLAFRRGENGSRTEVREYDFQDAHFDREKCLLHPDEAKSRVYKLVAGRVGNSRVAPAHEDGGADLVSKASSEFAGEPDGCDHGGRIC